MKIFPIFLLLLLALPQISFGAEEIKIGTIERPPYSIYEDGVPSSGFSLELIEEISAVNDLEIEYVSFDVFSDLVTAVAEAEVDMAVANISITEGREELMDFSQPIFESGLQIMMAEDKVKVQLWKVIWESGILFFLFIALLVLLVVAHLVWFFERGKEAKHDYFRDDYFGGIWDAFWWSFIIVTMGGFENEQPRHYIGRALALFWVLTSLFFVSALTAQITTALTVAELSSGIDDYRDLKNYTVGAPQGTTIAEFLDKEKISYTPFIDFTDAVEALEAGTIDAAIGDAAVSQYYVANSNKNIVLAGNVFAKDNIGFAFPEDSEYYEIINSELITMIRSGTYQEIREKYFGIDN